MIIKLGSLRPPGCRLAYVAKYILDLNNIDYKNEYDFFINIGSDFPFLLSGFECAYVTEYGDKIKEKKKPNIKYELMLNHIVDMINIVMFTIESYSISRDDRTFIFNIWFFLFFNLVSIF